VLVLRAFARCHHGRPGIRYRSCPRTPRRERRLGPIDQPYGHLLPTPGPPPLPSTPAPAAKSRAITPVPEVSGLGTSVAVPQPRPCATSPATLPSPACPTTPSTFPAHYLNRLQFYPPLTPGSPWFRFSRMDSPQHGQIRDSDTGQTGRVPRRDPEEPPTLSRHRHSPSWPKSRRGLATDRPFKSKNFHGRVRTLTSRLAGRSRRSIRRSDETSGLNCWTNAQDRTMRYPTA